MEGTARGRLRRWWVAIGAGAVVLVVAGVTTALALTGRDTVSGADAGADGATSVADTAAPSAADAVRSFLGALAERDADKARSLLSPRARPGAEGPLLSERTLSDRGYFPPEGVRVKPQPDIAGASGMRAVVEARYEAADMPYEVRFELVRADGAAGDGGWLVDNPLLPLAVRHAVSDTVIIAGSTVRPKKTILVFPGAYVAELPPNPYVSAEPATVLAGPADTQVALHPRLRDGIQRAVEPLVRRHVDACARLREPDPADCPFETVPYYVYPLTVTRKVVEYPRIRVARGSWSDVAVTTETPGRAEVTGLTPPAPDLPEKPLEPITVTGSVEIVGGKLRFYPAAS